MRVGRVPREATLRRRKEGKAERLGPQTEGFSLRVGGGDTESWLTDVSMGSVVT